MSSGMSAFSRWMCSAIGRIFSSAKRRKVSCTSSKSLSRWRGPRRVGQRGEERRVAVRAPRSPGASSSASPVDAPLGLAPEQLRRELGDGVGDERAGERGLDVALGAVVEHRAAGLDRRRGVGQVVGQHLLGVDRRSAEAADGTGDDLAGHIDDGLGGGQVGGRHVRRLFGGHARRLPTGSHGLIFGPNCPFTRAPLISYSSREGRNPDEGWGTTQMARCHTHGTASSAGMCRSCLRSSVRTAWSSATAGPRRRIASGARWSPLEPRCPMAPTASGSTCSLPDDSGLTIGGPDDLSLQRPERRRRPRRARPATRCESRRLATTSRDPSPEPDG